ncbi:MAG: cytochrome b/b6 domain-containing protein [Pseudopelagicola sp.]|nr:cytochrome b/b6 domain-containing protein [Pseudopelagicola sp.]
MPILDTPAQYGHLTKVFHWLTALLILTALPLGLIAHNAPYATGDELAQKALLFSLHKTIGIAAFLFAALRILWAVCQTRPAPLHPERRLEVFAAHLAHWVLYGAMLIVPLSGWVHHAATTGFAPILWPFPQTLPLVVQSPTVAAIASSVHYLAMLALVAALLAHIAGALKHALIDRDITLRRMLPGRLVRANTTPNTKLAPTPKRHILPPLAAAGIWAAVIALGTLTAAPPQTSPAVVANALRDTPATSTNWQVESGEIGLTVSQFGTEVSGQFATWSADIDFNETAKNGTHGTVTARIAIASLTLGSVTTQALGPDFLAAENHPTALFKADILAADTGYVARGTLSLRGVERPLSLPFTLTIDGDTAAMQGALSLDRRDFAIGATLPKEDTLGFAVDVTIALTATRSTADTEN